MKALFSLKKLVEWYRRPFVLSTSRTSFDQPGANGISTGSNDFFSFKAWPGLKEHLQLSRFFIGENPVKGDIVLTHRRIFIVPTRYGLGFTLLLVLLLLIAFVYNNNLTYLLAFLLISLFVVTVLHTFRSLSGLVVAMGQHKPVFAGERAALPLHIENKSTVARYNLEILLEDTECCDVAPFTVQQVTLYSTTQTRGWHQFGTIRITCRFPLGLFRAWSLLRFDCPVLVYPKPASRSIPFPERSAGTNPQGHVTKGGSDDFYGLQEYQPGDAIKHIHWKSFAKGQGLFTKHYSQVHSGEVWLDYANTPGYGTEERLSQLCRWVQDAEAACIKYGFSLPGVSLPPAHGARHYANCLQALALFQLRFLG